jgi:MYND finger
VKRSSEVYKMPSKSPSSPSSSSSSPILYHLPISPPAKTLNMCKENFRRYQGCVASPPHGYYELGYCMEAFRNYGTPCEKRLTEPVDTHLAATWCQDCSATTLDPSIPTSSGPTTIKAESPAYSPWSPSASANSYGAIKAESPAFSPFSPSVSADSYGPATIKGESSKANDDADTVVMPKSTAPCNACGQVSTFSCPACHRTWYCSRGCQTSDWTYHQKVCDKRS